MPLGIKRSRLGGNPLRLVAVMHSDLFYFHIRHPLSVQIRVDQGALHDTIAALTPVSLAAAGRQLRFLRICTEFDQVYAFGGAVVSIVFQ